MMMMIVAPNSLVRQKEGAQVEEEEEAGGQRKGGLTRTLTPGLDAPTGPTQSGVSNASNMTKHGRRCGVPLYRRDREG